MIVEKNGIYLLPWENLRIVLFYRILNLNTRSKLIKVPKEPTHGPFAGNHNWYWKLDVVWDHFIFPGSTLKPRTSLFSQCIISSSWKTLFPFEQAHSLSFIDCKNNFHYNLFNKNRSLQLFCARRSCIKISQRVSHKSSSRTVSINTCLTLLVWNLQGQYLIYKTMQHYRISAQHSNSFNRHQQVVTKCKENLGLQNIYGNVCLWKTSLFLNFMSWWNFSEAKHYLWLS